MKKQTLPQEATIFPFRFTKLMILLAIAVILLCSAGIGVSIWRITQNSVKQAGDLLKSPLLIAICVFCIALMISVLIRSRYVLTENEFIAQFGFVKSKYTVKSFTSVTLDTDTRKLAVYMRENFFIVVIDPAQNNDFVQALRKVNPNIEFNFTLAEKKEEK